MAEPWSRSRTRVARTRNSLRLCSLAKLPLVATSVLALALSACGNSAPGTSSAPSAQQLYTEATNIPTHDASFTMTGSGTVLSPDASGTSQTTLNLAFQATGQATFSPDALNLHIAMAMTDPGSGSPTGAMTFDVVEVNHLVYIKGLIQMPGQPAQQSDMYSVTDAQSLGTSADLASVLAPPLTDLTTVGQQTIRGDKCWHLTGVDMTSGNASTTAPSTPADVDVWVRRSDGRIVQIQTHSLGALGVLFGAGEGMDFSPSVTLTFALTAFDKGITIGSPPADQVQD